MAWPHPEDASDPEFRSEEAFPAGSATSDSRELRAFLDAAPPSTIHVVEADPLYRRLFSQALTGAGYTVNSYASATEFLSAVGPDEAGCVLFAAEDPAAEDPAGGGPRRAAAGEDGVPPRPHAGSPPPADVSQTELLLRLTRSRSPLAAVAITATLPLEAALALLRRGALDVLERPVKRSVLIAAVRRAVAVSAARRDRRAAVRRLAGLTAPQFRLLGLLAASWPRWVIALRFFVLPGEIRSNSDDIVLLLGVATLAEAIEVYLDGTADPPRIGSAAPRPGRGTRG